MNSFFRNLGLGLAALSWLVAATSPHKTSELSWLEGTWKSPQNPSDQWTWNASGPNQWTGLHSSPDGRFQVVTVSDHEAHLIGQDRTHHKLRVNSTPGQVSFQCPHCVLRLEYYLGRTAPPELVTREPHGTATYRKT